MPYTQLKEKLEQLLTEDLSNRSTLQETRRNLFLNSEGSKVQQQLIDQKQSEIQSLSTLVEKKKTIVQLKDDQINAIRNSVKELEEKVLAAEIALEEERKVFGAKVAEMSIKIESGTALETKLTELSLQNEEYSAKIRELIYHIDTQNSETEKLKIELNAKTEAIALLVDPKLLEEKNTEIESLKAQLIAITEVQASLIDSKQLEEKTAEIERLQEKADLLADSEQQLKVLVSAQNNDIENLTKLSNNLKKQTEDIAAGWQHQQEQLLADNSNLLAELALLKETMIVNETPITTISEKQIAAIQAEKEQLSSQLQVATAELVTLKETLHNTAVPSASQSVSDEEIENIRQEKERLNIELQATRHELDVTTQQREEKIILLQSEISNLQTQIITLSNSINEEAEQKNLIGTQLEQLTSIVSEKEQKLNEMAKNDANDEFIDKLMFQANRLNDEKHRYEMLYTESEAELTLTKTNLATLTQLIEEQKNSISGLEETDKHVKLAQTLMLQVTDKTAAKQAINELVREIDRCIALLSE
ncbi:MAG TPA: hypothetical protein VNZ49_06025 [Bacteroidia bacterium]|jgi:hypothetical protein|nr:hypothetical protein [Bacteroidia bacterium]